MNYYVCILNSNLNELLPLHALASSDNKLLVAVIKQQFIACARPIRLLAIHSRYAAEMHPLMRAFISSSK